MPDVKLLFENLPPCLAPQRETLARCLEAMNRVMPLREVYLFGSHARGDARPDSDVDLCIMADGAAKQLEAAQSFRRGMRPIPAKPSFTLVPITPDRLGEKKSVGDHFFRTILEEGVLPPPAASWRGILEKIRPRQSCSAAVLCRFRFAA